MSRMGNWIMEMQEAAAELTRDQFIKAYGKGQVSVWDNANLWYEDVEPELIDEEFAYDGA